jgi:spore coat polysaccharide biosynthesis predicted glycosyltransferase SpsG
VAEFAALLSAAGFSIPKWRLATGSLEDAQALVQYARARDIDALLVDDYRIAGTWLDNIARAKFPIILFDDFAPLPSYRACSGVVNFTIGSVHLAYPGLSEDRVLRGPGYFPARRDLAKLRETRAGRVDTDPIRNVLVTIGGNDSLRLTWPVLESLSRVAPHAGVRALTTRAVAESRDARWYHDRLVVTTPFMAPYYDWADVCVSGGGLTKYESAYLGIPVAILSQTEEQQAETNIFAAEGLGYDVGGFENLTGLDDRLLAFLTQSELRRRLVDAGLDRFRPDSTTRTVDALLSWTS